MTEKEEFISIFTENIKREGADKLLDFLENKSDFFTAPASTRYHNAFEGGLLRHSLNVYKCLVAYLERGRVKDMYKLEASAETAAIVALLHDLCKVNIYRVSYRNSKNDKTGQWEKVPYYEIHDNLPYGHGEKSVFLIERFMKLRIEEAMAIRWHMGGFDDGGGFTISVAYQKYPLAVKLHLADLESTYLREKNTSTVNNR